MAKKSPHEIRCSVCEKGVLREKKIDQDLSPLLGLNVLVSGAPALVCSNCGEITVMGDVLEQVSLDLAASILRQEKLAPDEIRYLRKLLGYRQEDLADKLGVTRATVNRWETGGDSGRWPPCLRGPLPRLLSAPVTKPGVRRRGEDLRDGPDDQAEVQEDPVRVPGTKPPRSSGVSGVHPDPNARQMANHLFLTRRTTWHRPRRWTTTSPTASRYLT